jgi:hypothetical protein
MINGINGNNPYIGNANVARERADAARAPAARPEALDDQRRDARPSPAGTDAPGSGTATSEDSQGYLRRVQARSAAEDSRLEPFRAEDIPMANARALEAFASVANQREGFDGVDAELAGIDIRV